MMQVVTVPRAIRGLICLTLFWAMSLTPVAAGADPTTASQSFQVSLEKACAERKVDNRLAALVDLSAKLSLSEIPDAIKAAQGLKELRERVVFGQGVVKRWGELAPAEAFAHISSMPEGMSRLEAVRSVTPVYASRDIQGAAAAAIRMDPGCARNQAIQLIAEAWTRNDVKAAIKWVEGLPEEFPKQAAMRNIYFIWVHLDPAGFSPIADRLPPGDTRSAMIINVAGDWAALDPASAVKWARSLPQPAEQQTALATVAESWADVDPVAAAEFAAKLSPPDLKQRAVLAALERWATQDPHQAFLWITKCDDMNLQSQGIARILNVSIPVSPETAGQWVDQLAAGPVREEAIGCYAEAVCMWNPGAGARLALKTTDPAARQDRVERCVRQWLAFEPQLAKAWLKETGFPEEIKSRWIMTPVKSEP